MADLSEYLRKRGLTLEPLTIEDDPVLKTEGAVKEIAGMWENHATRIKMVIQARLNAIGTELLQKARPEEVPVLRQAFVEVAALIDDFEKYVAESRRQHAKSEGDKDNETPDENQEGL